MTIPYQISIKKKYIYMNLFEFKDGGIYKIICIKNNKVYYWTNKLFCSSMFSTFTIT